MRSGILILGAVVSLAAAQGALVFENEAVRETAPAAAETQEVRFRFTNEGAEPVKILQVDSTCGCLSATADREVYQPGQQGVITGVFKLGTFEGEVSKALVLHSTDPAAPRRELRVTITIPKVFEVEPEVTSWALGEAPAPKSVTVRMLGEKPLHITSITTTRESFKAELREIEKGRHYEIVLTPASTAEPLLGALRIETDSEVPRYRSRLAFFNVLRPRSAAGR